MNNGEPRKSTTGLVAVAIDKDKSSQLALKWTSDHLLQRGQRQALILIHVKLRSSPLPNNPHLSSPRLSSAADPLDILFSDPDTHTKELLLPFHCFCTRRDIECTDIIIEDVDVAKALIRYVTHSGIETLVLGAAKSGFLRKFRAIDIPASVIKKAPGFCNVYVISKGKLQSFRAASQPMPVKPEDSQSFSQASKRPDSPRPYAPRRGFEKSASDSPSKSLEKTEFFRSPFTRKGYEGKLHGEVPPDTDISFISSNRPSVDRMFPSFYDNLDMDMANPWMSSGTEADINSGFEDLQDGRESLDLHLGPELFSVSQGERLSTSSVAVVEEEMRRLQQELRRTMEMYSTACKEALTAKKNQFELQRLKMEERRKLEEAQLAEEAALAIAEQEKAKSIAAVEAAEEAKRIADLEAQKRISAEMQACKETEEKKKAIDALSQTDMSCRKYSIEEIESATDCFSDSLKIGEGGYGPVYKAIMDHIPVAIKVLRPDAAQGRSQFQQEVEILSCMRHPNMVLLLGVCPDYGCLVYEFMANGSLEDCLFRRGNTLALSWKNRFRIAVEIGTGLLFLHQTKPEPLVHRDLKPANILLDHNLVSKISDVGLARLVPPSVVDSVTQYRMTSTAGTFCYIDPEYQQTGMLGVKSDIYSLGIIFLQLITAKLPMGLTHHVERAIENGTFAQLLDPSVPDWPVEQALAFAKLALKCAELRRKDRPDLARVVLPELYKFQDIF